jgi:competence protein ComEA
LESLPGVGPILAQRIIEYREESGPFQSVDDLLNVKGIGPSLFEKIRDLVEV